MKVDNNTIVLKFSPQSVRELKQLSRNLNDSSSGIISKAIALLQIVQGRTIILKEKKKLVNLEIKKYADKPVLFRRG